MSRSASARAAATVVAVLALTLAAPVVVVGAELEEIVITATKRGAEALRDIPASISALSGVELENRNAETAQDFLKLVPGVNLTSTGDSPPRITIRGISSDIGTGSTTGILFGNVSFTDAYVPFVALDPNPFDLESVEVLKGPQGTLFGAGALNGAVRYVPQAPRFGEWELRYFGQYTTVADGGTGPSYGAAINVPVAGRDDLALRVMGFARETPGYIDNRKLGVKDANDLDQVGARGMLRWLPDPRFEAGATFAWQDTDANDPALSDNLRGRLETNNRPRLSFNDTVYDLADLSLRYSFDWMDVVSETAYVRKDGHNFFEASSRLLPNPPFPISAQEYFALSDTYSQELRVVSPSGSDSPWRWVGGVFWFEQHIREKLQVPLGNLELPVATLVPVLESIRPGLGSLFATTGEPNTLATDLDVRVKELALFADVTRTLFTDWELSLGARLYRTTSGGTNRQSGLVITAQYLSPVHVIDDSVSEHGINPKASLAWHVTDDALAYAAVSKGFRVGGIQVGITTPLSQNPAPPTFESDTIWNYETGVRTQWLDDTLRLDLTGYYETWKDPQTLQADASGLAVFISNVGGVKSIGSDLSLRYLLPIDGLELATSAAYANTVTTEPFTASNGRRIPVGHRWPLAPSWQTATTASYVIPFGDWSAGTFVTHTYLGKTISDLTTQAPVYGYQQWDAQIRLGNAALWWLPEVSLTVNNIANERGVTNRFSSGVPSADSAAVEVYYLRPRSVMLRLTGHFGA